jgi:hypothetical protein
MCRLECCDAHVASGLGQTLPIRPRDHVRIGQQRTPKVARCRSQMSEYHRLWVVPVRHLVTLFEVFNDLGAARAAQFHEEVVAVIHHIDHKRLHLLIVDLIRRVHILQPFGIQKQSRAMSFASLFRRIALSFSSINWSGFIEWATPRAETACAQGGRPGILCPLRAKRALRKKARPTRRARYRHRYGRETHAATWRRVGCFVDC